MTTGGDTPAPLFTHDQQGTAEHVWFADDVWDQVPVLDARALLDGPVRRVVVVGAHPDDETIGVGATIAAFADLDVAVDLVLATAGEASNPDSRVWTAERLAAQRLDEWHAASRELAPAAREHFLGHPDGGLAGREEQLVAALAPLLAPDVLVLAPWPHDGHPDHEAVGRAARTSAAAHGARCLFFPVWWWHWNDPSSARQELLDHAVVVEPGLTAMHRKLRALGCYPSQVSGLGPGPEHQPVVSGSVLRRARRPFEVVFTQDARPSPPAPADDRAGAFDAMYDQGEDPWGWEDSWYERRRRALVASVLLRPHHERVLELGCATGLLTRDLAARAGHVDAVDVSERALTVARHRDLAGVTWHRAELPDGLPDGPYDLVVVSEVAYFLRPSELVALVRRVRERMAAGAELVLADWAHPTRDIPLDGPAVHELVDGIVGLPRLACYRDPDVWVELWSAADGVARSEGLV